MRTFVMLTCCLLAVSFSALVAAAPAAVPAAVAVAAPSYVRLLPQDCRELYRSGVQRSGVYKIYPSESASVDVYCDMGCDDDSSSGRGWTVIQKRFDGSINFFRNWDQYRAGFGNKSGEHWLGLENMHTMTSNKPYMLRVDMEDYDGNSASALYKVFSVGSEETGYRLQASNYAEGNAGDSLGYHNGHKFSTYDREQQRDYYYYYYYDYYYNNYYQSCAKANLGGFWYSNCGFTNPNGIYMGTQQYYNYYYWGINVWWGTWRGSGYSLKSFSMKIRPLN